MNIMQEDNKIVDLVTFIGEAFPKNNFLTNSSSDIHKQTDHLHKTKSHLHTSFDDCDKEKEGAIESLDEGMELEETAECLTEWLIDGREPLIRALIKPHEGTYSHEPFDIHPRQMVGLYQECIPNIHVLTNTCVYSCSCTLPTLIF